MKADLVILWLDGARDGLLDAGVHVTPGLLRVTDQEVDQLVQELELAGKDQLWDKDSGCATTTVVECMPHDQEVVGSTSTKVSATFLYL